MIYTFKKHIITFALMLISLAMSAQDNDKILNRQYADLKPIHFGFSVGLAYQNLGITNNGYVTEDGHSWFAEIPNNSPGFAVGVLADLRLSKHFNLRFTPGMQFGNKIIKYYDANAPEADIVSQNVKSTYVVAPLDIKFSALRYHNYRPYFIGGITGVFDVSKRKKEQLQFENLDAMLNIGFGCDCYLPFFKFIPEIKFCFGLRNILKKDRPDLEDDKAMQGFTNSVSKVANNMVVLTFYFE